MEHLEIIDKIKKLLQSTDSIPADKIMDWMKLDDIEILGAISSIITEHYDRVEPAIPMETICNFQLNYFRRCLIENPDGEYSDSRYTAGYDLAMWFKALWADKKVPKSIIKDLKSMLSQVYKSGDEEVRNCIVTSVLEHLFENPEIGKYFSDWQKNPVLKVAYNQALEWGKCFRGRSSNSRAKLSKL